MYIQVVMQSLIQSDHKVAMLTGNTLSIYNMYSTINCHKIEFLSYIHVCVYTHFTRYYTIYYLYVYYTGDSLLTSLHVAKQVDICTPEKPVIILQAIDSGTPSGLGQWLLRDDSTGEETYIPFSINSILSLYEQYNMLTTEKDLLAVIDKTGGKGSELWVC